MNYYIGEYYRYYNGKDEFKLIEVIEFIFHFENGHWCTDNVFIDLVRIKTGKQVYEEIQFDLFHHSPQTTDI